MLAVALAGLMWVGWQPRPAVAGIFCEVDADCGTDACETPKCSNGSCVNQKVDCDDNDACTTDSCDPQTGCQHAAVACDDGDACTNDSCDSQSGCVFTAKPVDDKDPCTTDSCDSQTGDISHTPIDCNDQDSCTADFCSGGECFHDNQCRPGLDPRQCYDVSPRTPFTARPVSLVDQFGSFSATLQTARELCAPAIVGEEEMVRGVPFLEGPHVLSYRLIGKSIRPFTPIKGLAVQNVFGTAFIDVKYPERLMIPTAKSLVGPPDPLQPPLPSDMTCYYVRRSKGAPPIPIAPTLVVTTQLETNTTLKLRKLNRICVASEVVEDERTPAPQPGNNVYLCYQNKVPPLGPVDKAFTSNELEPNAIYRITGVHEEVCLPSTIEIID